MKMTKLLSMLLAVVMMLGMFATVALADFDYRVNEMTPDDTTSENTLGFKIKSPIQALLGVITVIAGAVAVGMLIFIGIKYMTKGAGAKAEVKSTLLPYLIGAVLVASASGIASIALNL